MQVKEIYKTAGGSIKEHFGRIYFEALFQVLLRLPFWGAVFALFANITIKRSEDFTRGCLFALAILCWFFIMMPARFKDAASIKNRLTGAEADHGYFSCLRLGLFRSLAGTPVLLFVASAVLLWWGKNISPINDFNKRIRTLGTFFVGEEAAAQDKGYAGISAFALIVFLCALIAFISWQLSYGAEFRKKGSKRFYRGIRGLTLRCALINAAIAFFSVLPSMISFIIYSIETVKMSGSSAAGRAMGLISLLGMIPPSNVILIAALDVILLWIPLYVLRKHVCALCVMREDGELNET